MRAQIKVRPISNAPQLVPLLLLVLALGKESILNIDRAIRVMGQLLLRLFIESQVVSRDSKRREPLITVVNPLLMGSFVVARANEILHLHLFKLARPKDEVARRNLVAERLANLRDTKRQFATAGRQH